MTNLKTVILICFSFIVLFSCSEKQTTAVGEPTTVALINPSLGYLESFDYLIQNKIIEINNLDLHIVQYANLTYSSATAIEDYIKSNQRDYMRQTIYYGDLNVENLFTSNPLSPSFRKIFDDADAVFFLGGADFPPEIYHHKTSLLTRIETPYRHYFELSFMFHLFGGSQDTTYKPLLQERPDFVVVGFCLGMQSMNAAAGGNMYQDIPSEIYGCEYVEDVLALDIDSQHRNYNKNLSIDSDLNGHNFHRVNPLPDGFLAERVGLNNNPTPTVCSSHHQAVNEIGQNFKIAATSIDGKVVEALEHQVYKNVFATQFHPEFSSLYDPNSAKLKHSPSDSLAFSEHEMLVQSNSFRFHLDYWKFVSDLVNETRK